MKKYIVELTLEERRSLCIRHYDVLIVSFVSL